MSIFNKIKKLEEENEKLKKDIENREKLIEDINEFINKTKDLIEIKNKLQKDLIESHNIDDFNKIFETYNHICKLINLESRE